MKKILVVFGILFLGAASAAAIPSPILGEDTFSSWSNFEGIFSQIYKDVRIENSTEICERVLQWPEFWEDGEQIFSLEDCEDFVGTTVSDFLKSHEYAYTNIRDKTEALRVKYEFEKALWHYQHDLERRTALSSIWNDGDGGVENPPSAEQKLVPEERTSPVDLVTLWNQIDHILFGVQATYPKFASFVPSDDPLDEEWAETPDNDPWLDQRTERLPAYTPESKRYYTDGEKSIAGGYEEKAHMFEYELNPSPLITGAATTQTFDMAFTGMPMPMSGGMNFDTAETVPASPDIPEQESILQQIPMGELNGAFAKFFRQQSSVELKDTQNDGARNKILQNILVLAPEEKSQNFVENIKNLLQIRKETGIEDTGQLELLPLQQFNTVLDAWISVLNKWQLVNVSFLTHDRK